MKWFHKHFLEILEFDQFSKLYAILLIPGSFNIKQKTQYLGTETPFSWVWQTFPLRDSDKKTVIVKKMSELTENSPNKWLTHQVCHDEFAISLSVIILLKVIARPQAIQLCANESVILLSVTHPKKKTHTHTQFLNSNKQPVNNAIVWFNGP